LQTGLLRLLEVQVVLPDGEIFSAPGEDELPPPVSLRSLATDGNTEALFHLALAPVRSSGTNMASTQLEADTASRYYRAPIQSPDAYTDAVPAELVVLRKSARVLLDTEPRAHLVSLPIIKLRKTSTGGYEIDGRF